MDKIASIKVEEKGSTFVVTGPYNEMKDVYPTLKKYKFRYDGNTRSWWIEKSNFKGAIEDVEQLVNSITIGTKEKQEQDLQNKQKQIDDFFAKTISLKNIDIVKIENKICIKGLPYDLFSPKARELGGRWNSGLKGFDFTDASEKLFDLLEKYNKEIDSKASDIKPYNNKKIGISPYIVTLRYGNNTLQIESSSNELNDSIIKEFPEVRKSGNVFYIHTLWINDIANSVKYLTDKCDQLGASALDKKIKEEKRKIDGYLTIRHNTAWGSEDMNDFYVGQIVKNQWNSTPEWLKIVSVKRGQRYEGYDYFFTVSYEPLSQDELAVFLGELKEKRTSHEAKKRIVEIIEEVQKRGIKPSKLEVKGDLWIDEKSKNLRIYGGGQWICIDNDDIYYVQNNGGDGDYWGANNVSTGGAGAIGWKLNSKELSAELLSLLPIAKYQKE